MDEVKYANRGVFRTPTNIYGGALFGITNGWKLFTILSLNTLVGFISMWANQISYNTSNQNKFYTLFEFVDLQFSFFS